MPKKPCAKLNSLPLSCFDALPMHMMVLDNGGKLIYANPSCKRLLGLVEVHPCPTLDSLIVPEDQSTLIKDLLQTYRGNTRKKIPYGLLTRKGGRIDASVTLIPVPNKDEVVKNIIVILSEEKN